ncbi:hypothetical protein ACMV8I_18240 [Ewingella sp. S1.OA.A_B6]
MSTDKPRRPHGRWTYFIMHEDILWPCPVHWEWEDSYGGWLPYYLSPTFEFVAGDPLLASKVSKDKPAPDSNPEI